MAPVLLTNHQSLIVAGQRLAFSCCGHGPALLVLDDRAEQWTPALSRHYRVVQVDATLFARELPPQQVADQIMALLRMLNIHNPHLLVGADYLPYAVELLARPQALISWHSAALVTTSSRTAGGSRVRWSAQWRRVLARWLQPRSAAVASQPLLPDLEQQRWQRALSRNRIPCRIIDVGGKGAGDQLWGLFGDAERVTVGQCQKQFVAQLGELLISFHAALRKQRHQPVGM